MKINLYNKIAVSSEDSLDPAPEAHAGLRQGVPGEGPHYLPDQVSGFVGGFALTQNSETPPAKYSKELQ